MKKLFPLILILSFFTSAFATDVAVLVKQHNDHSKMPDRPYGKNDLSFGAFLEFFEGPAGWRIGAMYAGDLSQTDGEGESMDIKRVITPELTLLFQDNIWETGISVLKDYVTTDEDSDWGGTYFQMQLGLNFPMGKSGSLGIHAFFPFDSFSDVSKFKFDNLDFGISARFRF